MRSYKGYSIKEVGEILSNLAGRMFMEAEIVGAINIIAYEGMNCDGSAYIFEMITGRDYFTVQLEEMPEYVAYFKELLKPAKISRKRK